MRVVSRMPGGMRMQRYLEIKHAMLTQSGIEDHPCGKRRFSALGPRAGWWQAQKPLSRRAQRGPDRIADEQLNAEGPAG